MIGDSNPTGPVRSAVVIIKMIFFFKPKMLGYAKQIESIAAAAHPVFGEICLI